MDHRFGVWISHSESDKERTDQQKTSRRLCMLCKWKQLLTHVKWPLPSKHRVWLPSRQTHTSLHCSSRLRNKMNLWKSPLDSITAIRYSEKQSNESKYHFIFSFIFFLYISRTYIWSEDREVRNQSWNWHYVDQEWAEKIVRKLSNHYRTRKD